MTSQATGRKQTLVQSPVITVTSADTPLPCDAAQLVAEPEGGAARVASTDLDREGTQVVLVKGVKVD